MIKMKRQLFLIMMGLLFLNGTWAQQVPLSEGELLKQVEALGQADEAGADDLARVIDQALRDRSYQLAEDSPVFESLLKALKETRSPSAAVACADFLTVLAGEEEVSELQEIFEEAPHGLEAVRVLAVIPGRKARLAFFSGLESEKEQTVIACLTALGNRGEKKAVGEVEDLLDSESVEVRRAALMTLGRIGGERALEEILGYAEDEGLRDGAGNALLRAATNTEEGKVFEALEMLIEKGSPSEQNGAFTLMARRDPIAAFPALLVALKNEASPLHEGALRALPLFRDVGNREELASVLKETESETAVSMLAHFRDYEGPAFLEAVRKKTDDEEKAVRLAALETLGYIGEAEDLKRLAWVAQAGDQEERDVARAAMERLDHPDVAVWLVETIQQGVAVSEESKEKDYASLDKKPAQMARTILPELLNLCRERRVTAARPLLLELAQREEREVRYLAVESLAEVGTGEDLPQLLAFLQEGKRSGYQKRCVQAMGRILERSGSEKWERNVMESWAAGKDEDFQRALLPLLVQIGNAQSLRLTQLAVKQERENRLQREALKAMGEWPDTSPLSYLKDFLRETKDDALHTLALRSFIQLLPKIEEDSEQLTALRFAWDHAKDGSEKKSVLAGMSSLLSLDALQLALDGLDQKEVMAEAAIAACQVVQAMQLGEQAEPAKQALTDAYFAHESPEARGLLLQYGRSLLPVWAPECWEGDPFSGDYVGTLYNGAGETAVVGHLLATNFGQFKFILRESFDAAWNPWAVLEGPLENDEIWLTGFGWEATIKGDTLEATLPDTTDRFVLKRVGRLSPTLGKKPPEDGIVLFDGSDFSEWVGDGGEVTWTLAAGDAMEVNPKTGGIATRRAFGDMELHLEFRSPYSPGNPHQFYGNSGVFIQRCYEVQVLMSHGKMAENNDCGAFYGQFLPAVNMCAPPLQWQTYDITFRAARFNEAGEKTENARVTVLHNGVAIHDDLELPGPSFENLTDPKVPTPLYLQDHHNRVQYRNIWVRELASEPQSPAQEVAMYQAPLTKSNAKPEKTDQTFRVALLQMEPAGNDQQANLEKGEAFCRKAKERGADLALMPEMWNIGYQGFWIMGEEPNVKERWQAQAVERDSDWVHHFRELAKELNMAIGVTYLEAWGSAPRNSLTVVDRHGEDLFTYAKMHTCDFADFEAATTPGEEFFVADLDTENGPVKLGAMICYDREFPESARLLMLKGAEVVVTPNACQLDDIRLAQFGTRALENSMAMAMTNYAAPFCGGRSVAYQVDGSQLTLAGNDEEVALVDFEMEHIRNFRQTSIWGDAFRRPHRYKALIQSDKLDVFKRDNAFGEPFKAEER